MFVSAEIRWFYPDECPTNLHRWFGEMSPAPGGGKLRIDEYLSQTNQSEVSIKKRGGRPGVEIKGLIAVCRSELVPFAPYVELWCKWRLHASALEMTLGPVPVTRLAAEAALDRSTMGRNLNPLERRGLVRIEAGNIDRRERVAHLTAAGEAAIEVALPAGLAPALIGIEACHTAHYWGREIAALGHDVRLMPPQFVKPYVKSQKNERPGWSRTMQDPPWPATMR
jgi:DNA-binding MarR family transcriptional regulator